MLTMMQLTLTSCVTAAPPACESYRPVPIAAPARTVSAPPATTACATGRWTPLAAGPVGLPPFMASPSPGPLSPCPGSSRIGYAPVLSNPSMQWAVPNRPPSPAPKWKVENAGLANRASSRGANEFTPRHLLAADRRPI